MNGLFAAHCAAGDFDSAIVYYLIDVHVGLRAATGLPDAQRKMITQLAGDDLVGGLHDELAFVGWELAEILIDERAGFFQDAKGANELARHGVFTDREMDERARGLRAPVAVRWDFHLPHAVGFDARRAVHRRRAGSFGHAQTPCWCRLRLV